MAASCIFPTNIKGGTGKTTVTIDIGCTLANKGYRVLFIDTDKQGATYKTITRMSVPGIDEHEEIYKQFKLEPRTTATLQQGCWWKGIDKYHVQLPVIAETTFFPVKLYTKYSEYASEYRKFVESVKEDYDFIIIDLPQYDPDYIGIITENHEMFGSLIPLIVTEAASTEVDNGIETYKSFIKNIKGDEALAGKVKPMMIINKNEDVSPVHDEDEELSLFYYSTKRRDENYKKIGGQDVPLFRLPNQKQASAARNCRSFLLDDITFNKHYVSPGDIDPNEIDWGQRSFDSFFTRPTLNDRRYQEKQEDFRLYAERIERIAEEIEEIVEAKPGKKTSLWVNENEKNRLSELYHLKECTR